MSIGFLTRPLSLVLCVSLLASGAIAHIARAPFAHAEVSLEVRNDIPPGSEVTEYVGGTVVSRSRGGIVQNRYLDVPDHFQCMIRGVSSHKIREFRVKASGKFSGKVKMLCGKPPSSGYSHIAAGHQNDWFQKYNWLKNKDVSGWDHYMFAMVKGTLLNPTHIKRQRGSKICYQGKVYRELRVNGKLKKHDTYVMKVVLSTNYKRVITAYPGGRC